MSDIYTCFDCNVYHPLLLHILRFQKFITMFSFLSFFFLARNNYRILNETDRKNDYQTLKNVVRKCDGRLRRGWYRFMGAAGTKMPSQVVPISRCRTDATGWLSGSHPTVNQGAVRPRVCFHWAGLDRRRRQYDRSCMWSRYIRVLNCTTFLVYELIPIKRCHLRYKMWCKLKLINLKIPKISPSM